MTFILGLILGFLGTMYLVATGIISQKKLTLIKNLFKKETDGPTEHT